MAEHPRYPDRQLRIWCLGLQPHLAYYVLDSHSTLEHTATMCWTLGVVNLLLAKRSNSRDSSDDTDMATWANTKNMED